MEAATKKSNLDETIAAARKSKLKSDAALRAAAHKAVEFIAALDRSNRDAVDALGAAADKADNLSAALDRSKRNAVTSLEAAARTAENFIAATNNSNAEEAAKSEAAKLEAAAKKSRLPAAIALVIERYQRQRRVAKKSRLATAIAAVKTSNVDEAIAAARKSKLKSDAALGAAAHKVDKFIAALVMSEPEAVAALEAAAGAADIFATTLDLDNSNPKDIAALEAAARAADKFIAALDESNPGAVTAFQATVRAADNFIAALHTSEPDAVAAMEAAARAAGIFATALANSNPRDVAALEAAARAADKFIAALVKSNPDAVAVLEAAGATAARIADKSIAVLDMADPDAVDKSKAAAQKKRWHKARLAILALHLKATPLAETMCQLDSDPTQRTLFIDEFSKWHGDLSALADLLASCDHGPLRSAVALAVGNVPAADFTDEEVKSKWVQMLSKWYRTHSDTSTHSAAGWALRQWKVEPPEIPPSKPHVVNGNWFVNTVGMTMLKIPVGTFIRKDSDPKRAIDQEVTLTRSFVLASREVTRAQFQQFIDDPYYPDKEKPKGWPEEWTEDSPRKQHPVQNVNWYDAVLFCNWLSKKEGLQPPYERTGETHNYGGYGYDIRRPIHDANGYRLPTEAEWEYACRAETVTAFSHADEESLLDHYAVYEPTPMQVSGNKLPNAWGLFDMHGNVLEWCQDWHRAYGSNHAVADPVEPDQGTERVLRGGSFSRPAHYLRSAYRNKFNPTDRYEYVGFRVARTYP